MSSLSSKRSLRAVAVVVTLAVIGTACGRDDPQAASDGSTASTEDTAAATQTSGATEGTEGATSSGPETADETETTEATAGLAGLDQGGFGDLGVLCSEGETEPVELSGEPGLNGTTINVATFADPGFQGRPGLNQEFFDTAEAVVEWCNEHGGVRGYEIVVDLRDAKLTEHTQRVVESCDTDFFMVGGGAVADNSGQADRLACGLPDIAGFVVTNEAAEADLVVQPVPNPVDEISVGQFRWIEEHFPDATKKVGTFSGDLATLQLVNDRYTEAMQTLGWEIIYADTYNVGGESNWKPFAQAIRDAGVELLVWTGEPANLAALRKAMDDIDYSPEVVRAETNHYDQLYIDVGGESVHDTYLRNAFVPFELADEYPAMSDYFTLMETYRPDGKFPANLAAQGLSAWLLFLDSLGQCVDAGDVTRDCVYETARSHSEWTGGGLHSPQDVAAGSASQCYVVLEATAEGFVPLDNDPNLGPFNCAPENRMELTGDYGQGATCPSGKEDPLPSECAP